MMRDARALGVPTSGKIDPWQTLGVAPAPWVNLGSTKRGRPHDDSFVAIRKLTYYLSLKCKVKEL
jgi:hypothetical protein